MFIKAHVFRQPWFLGVILSSQGPRGFFAIVPTNGGDKKRKKEKRKKKKENTLIKTWSGLFAEASLAAFFNALEIAHLHQ